MGNSNNTSNISNINSQNNQGGVHIINTSLYKLLKNSQVNHLNFKKIGDFKKKPDKKSANTGINQIYTPSHQSGSKYSNNKPRGTTK